jgi:hypothetical protein
MVVITRWLIDMVYLYLKSEQTCVYKHHAQPRSTTIIYVTFANRQSADFSVFRNLHLYAFLHTIERKP